MAAIAVTQSDLTAMELRVAAGREKNSAASRRMLALAMVLDGADRTSAAKTCGMDRQTLRDWVHRYNATGLTGLRNRCLLYTSDAADDLTRVDLGGRRIIKKKKKK